MKIVDKKDGGTNNTPPSFLFSGFFKFSPEERTQLQVNRSPMIQ